MLKFRRQNDTAASSLEESQACAILVGDDDAVVDNSPNAFPLLKAWEGGAAAMTSLVAAVRESRSVAEERLTTDDGSRFSLTGVFHAGSVMIVARDTTVADRMTEALLESRTMLKGLLDRAADLSFEVDEHRRFRFLSPTEAFGRNLEHWSGRSADALFWADGNVPSRNPLAAKSESVFEAVPVSFEGGDKRWVSFSVEPIVGDDGMPHGVRGICRDVSRRVEAERQTRMDNLRLGLQQRITHILNTIESADGLLDSASNELLDVLRADLAWSVVKYPEGLVPVSICGDSVIAPNIENIWRQLAMSGDAVMEIEDGERHHLAVRLEQGAGGIGMFVVSRDTSLFPWADHEKTLLEDVMGALAAAFGKAQLIDRLTRLSTLDELTGISNRRAFVDAVERRLSHQCRSGQSGCLLFIDLDHFKEINDTLGHKAGDQAIQLVAGELKRIIRASDYAGRYGGDEFVVWLEDISVEDAAAKAQALIDIMPKVRAEIGAESLKLSASVGVCPSVPGSDLKFGPIADRADAALYEVKKAGRSHVAIAPAPAPQDNGEETGVEEQC